ncbi:hypothetical protein M0802_013884 [Mischocyttarus mexicanus]|nr:hypothetical protein M0802_013884 [Mischocyttarus mexicanus]
MAQNDKLKLNFTKFDNNYTISKRQATSEPEIVAESMDMENQWNLKSRDEVVKKRRKDQTITNLQEIQDKNPENFVMEKITPKSLSPPINIEAQVIGPLVDLLKELINNEFTLRQLKDNHVKVQVNTSDSYRSITKALKERNANFYTYQAKKDRSYKVVLRGMHPKTDTDLYQTAKHMLKQWQSKIKIIVHLQHLKIEYLDEHINCNIPLKSPEQVENMVMNFTDIIQQAGWDATKPEANNRKFLTFPEYLVQKIKEKRKIKSIWQKQKSQSNKRRLNTITKAVKRLIQIHFNENFHTYISNLSPNDDTNYSL